VKMSKYFAMLLLSGAFPFALSGCGGSDGHGSTTPAVAAPSALSYASPASGIAGVAITSLSPTVTGTVTGYSISPVLPAGLSFDTAKGVISGTPTATAAQASYTITASNASGSTTFALALSVSAAITVGGTAASGAPIAGATVTLKDAAGKSQTATTGTDGSFQVIVNGLTAPFLLSVGSAGPTLYSYAGQSGTANLNPYTTVALQAYYKAQGTDVATVFGTTLSSASFPNSQQLMLLVNPITALLQPYLSNAGVAQADQFNPFSSSFSANHTGFDQVLDRTQVNSSLLAFSVDNGSGTTAGAISSAVTVQATAASGNAFAAVSVTTTTTDSATNSSSTSQQTVPVGTSGAQQSALAAAQSGVLTLLNNLVQVAATKGTAITAADVAPYIDAGFLDEGQNAAAITQQVLQFFTSIPAGATVTPSIYRLNNFDASNATLDATADFKVTSGTAAIDTYLDDNDNPNYGMVFKQAAGGNWAFYGHQTSTKAHINVTKTMFYDANGSTPNSPTSTLDMQAQVTVLQGSLSGASVSGPANSLPDCSQTPSPLTQSSIALSHDPGVYNGNQDRYDLACSFTDAGALSGTAPPAGTLYTFGLTSAGTGTTAQQGYALNSVTTDSGDLTQINGVSRAAFTGSNTAANVVGTTLTLTYTPPTTYSVLYSDLSAFCQNAAEASSGGGSDISGTLNDIPPGTNSGTIQIPSQCDGAPTTTVAVSVNFIGVNGERSQVTQNIHN
jgi:large repetitive protein